jgi:hypothetical protein
VAVAYIRGGDSKRFACTLLGADSLGIIVSYEQDGRMLKRFLPWSIVEYIHLVDEETRQWREQRRSQRPLGFSS